MARPTEDIAAEIDAFQPKAETGWGLRPYLVNCGNMVRRRGRYPRCYASLSDFPTTTVPEYSGQLFTASKLYPATRSIS